jgi:chemotaxis response regulator CheB
MHRETRPQDQDQRAGHQSGAADGGGHTIAESEQTAVVYGMPREAIELGGAEFVLPADGVAQQLVALVGQE